MDPIRKKVLLLSMLYVAPTIGKKPTLDQLEKYATNEGFFKLPERELDLRILIRKKALLEA